MLEPPLPSPLARLSSGAPSLTFAVATSFDKPATCDLSSPANGVWQLADEISLRAFSGGCDDRAILLPLLDDANVGLEADDEDRLE